MAPHLTKAALYAMLERMRRQLSLPDTLQAEPFLRTHFPQLAIDTVPFTTRTILGMLVRTQSGGTLVVNASLHGHRRDAALLHEWLHYLLHSAEDTPPFCAEGNGETSYIEWQADEAAAELLLPYRVLLPAVRDIAEGLRARVAEHTDPFATQTEYERLLQALSDRTGADTHALHMRLRGLHYELRQFLSGTLIDEITPLSRAEQARRGLTPEAGLYPYVEGMP